MSSGYASKPPFSTVDNVKKTIAQLVPQVHLQNFKNFEEASRSIFDTQDEDYTDTNFTEGVPETLADGFTTTFTCDDSGSSSVNLPPDGVALWQPATSVLQGLEQNAVYFIAMKLNVRFTTSSAELQFKTVISGGGIDPIIAANLAIEVPAFQQYGLVQPIITFIAPAAAVGKDVYFTIKALQGDADIAGRSISIYKAFGPPDATITIAADDEADIKADLSHQNYRNALFSLRTKFERLAVLYGDDRYDGPGGTFEAYAYQTYHKFTVNGGENNTTNLVAAQLTPWDPTNSRLVNLQDNGVYLVTCYYQFEGGTDRSTIFRIREVGGGVISGSQTSEDATNGWETYGLTIYFTAPADAEGKEYEIDIWHNGNADIGDRAISIIQIS